MGQIVMRLIATFHVFDYLPISKQKFLPEKLLFLVLQGNFRDEFPHIVQNDVFAVWMQVGVEGTIHEANMDLILYDIELFFVSFWSDFTEVLRDFSLAECDNTLVLEVGTKGDFDEALIGCDVEYEIVVVELSFEELVCALVIE